jgi:signal transduction histidine kinase
MILRTLPLRVKLISAMLLPLGAIGGFLGVQTADGIEQRSDARAQSLEVERALAIVDYASEVGGEGRLLASPTTTIQSLAEKRSIVDSAWAAIARPALDVNPAQVVALRNVADEIDALRQDVGTDPVAFRAALSQEATASESASSIARFSSLQSDVLEAFDFDRSLLTDAASSQAVNELLIIQRVSANLTAEHGAILSAQALSAESLTPDAVEAVRGSLDRTDEAIALYRALATPSSRASFDEFLESPSFSTYDTTRNKARALEVGGAALSDNIIETAEAITASSAGFNAFELAKSTQVDRLAAQAVETSNETLIRTAAISGGLAFVIAMILFGLYQAIRRPLRKLTEQSRRVADHDLPEIVRAIRNGDIDSVPEIEMIETYTTDEIGDLVHAFNGMHRTAVELAVEQASSRRVVADMFVNLGRRNQKLLNRMLKGLTLLEREEQDPDKLAALYQVDHLATRMRRNAESLLILAGAPQARSWEQSVPIYDVVNASLSEVENYERVDVDTTEGELIKGEYVADLAHLLAELTENALAFSPPGSRVEIIAQPTRRGYAIIVNDRGIGMPTEALAEANKRIAEAGTQGETPSEFLGHYVVGRLAARNGFQVDLLESAAGVSARVLLPDSVFDRDDDVDVPNDAAELFPTRQAAVSEPFATVPDSLDINDEPFATIPDSLDINDEPFATIPDSLDINDEPGMTETSAGVGASAPFDFELDDEVAFESEVELHNEFERESEVESEVSTALEIESNIGSSVELEVDAEAIGEVEASAAKETDSAVAAEAELDHESAAESEVELSEETAAAVDTESQVALEQAIEVASVPVEAPSLPQAEPSQPLVVPGDLPYRRPFRIRDEDHSLRPVKETVAPTTTPTFAAPPAGLPKRIPAPVIAVAEPELVVANAFGVQRRKPGAQLPTTTITPRAAVETDLDDPDAVRSSLSGFQSGTFRADKENQ